MQKIYFSVFALLILFSAQSVGFADMAKLNTEQIIEFLSDREVSGNQNGREWQQYFTAGGFTSYSENNGLRPSGGQWKAEDDKYCSQWPPSSHWDCYFFSADGDQLVFTPVGGGDPWPAVRKPKN